MGDISDNFSRYEFKCKCGVCNQDAVDVKLIEVLERIRMEFNGSPIMINSGNRCEAYNKKVGGRPKSYHLRSEAADIVISGVIPSTVYLTLRRIYPDSLGLGNGNTFTHVDVRKKATDWNY